MDTKVPVGVVTTERVPSHFKIKGRPWAVVDRDHDLLYVMPKHRGYNDNPRNPEYPEHQPDVPRPQKLPADVPIRGVEFTPEEITEMARIIAVIKAARQTQAPRQNYPLYHARNKVPLGVVAGETFTSQPKPGMQFTFGGYELKVVEVEGDILYVVPTPDFRWAVVSLTRGEGEKAPRKIFQIKPFYTRREAVAYRWKAKGHLQAMGYRLRKDKVGRVSLVEVVPWDKVPKYIQRGQAIDGKETSP